MRYTAMLVTVFALMCCFESCGSQDGALSDGSLNTPAANISSSCNSGTCSTSEIVCASDMEAEDSQTCATVSVMETIGDAGGSADENITLKEHFATTLSGLLLRANVTTDKDVQNAILFEEWKQALGYTCPSGDECNNLAVEYGSQFANADILVIPTIYLVGDTYYLFASAWNMKKNKSIARFGTTAVGEAAIAAMAGLGGQVADAVKEQKHCLKMTPKAVAVDFGNAASRSKTFAAEIKNLKNEAADVGSVDFSLENPQWGSLSAANAGVSGGKAEVIFTMTKSKTNTLTASYSSDTENPVEAKSAIVPLCGLVITVNGTRNFTVNQEPFALYEPGSWWTYLGSSTVAGYIPLTEGNEEDPNSIMGTGWYNESQSTTSAAHLIAKNPDGNVVECDISGTESGKSIGDWIVWGTKQDKTASIQAIGLGLSGGGMVETGSCPGINVSTSGAYATLAQFGDKDPVSIQLENGATATASGHDYVSDYNYTLKVMRAGE